MSFTAIFPSIGYAQINNGVNLVINLSKFNQYFESLWVHLYVMSFWVKIFCSALYWRNRAGSKLAAFPVDIYFASLQAQSPG
jgi:hypothetical protein